MDDETSIKGEELDQEKTDENNSGLGGTEELKYDQNDVTEGITSSEELLKSDQNNDTEKGGISTLSKDEICDKILIKVEQLSEDENSDEVEVDGASFDEPEEDFSHVVTTSSISNDVIDNSKKAVNSIIKNDKKIGKEKDDCLKCLTCNRVFTCISGIKQHKCYVCHICGKISSDRNYMTNHIRSHSGLKPFECTFCQTKFGYRASLKRHVQCHHTSEKKFTCEFCGESYARADRLTTHIETAHRSDVIGGSGDGGVAGSSSSSTLFSEICAECGKGFRYKKNLTNHMLKSHSGIERELFTCPECKREFNKPGLLLEHSLIHSTGEQKPFRCTACPKKFSRAKSLRDHIKFHAGQFSCPFPECGKNFHKRGDLETHSLSHVTGESKPLSCEFCDKKFGYTQSLKNHVTLFHPNNQDSGDAAPLFTCDHCSKTFGKRGNFQRHLLTHISVEEREFECEFCSKKFKRSDQLKIHIVRMHKDVNIGSEQCE